MLLHVVQRLAKHLQHFQRHFLRQADGAVGAEEGDRNAALLLKTLGGAARRGHQVGAVHIHRPHAVEEGAQVADLRLRQRLELLEIAHAGVEIALHELAQNLQAHLQADEALQRPIVEIAGDADALLFAGLLRRLFRLGQRGCVVFRFPRLCWRLLTANAQATQSGDHHGPVGNAHCAAGRRRRPSRLPTITPTSTVL